MKQIKSEYKHKNVTQQCKKTSYVQVKPAEHTNIPESIIIQVALW